MKTLLVVHELKGPESDYEELGGKLQSFAEWWHCIESTWIVKADMSPKDLADVLVPLVGMDDLLFVVDISGRNAAWTQAFPEDCQSFLRGKL